MSEEEGKRTQGGIWYVLLSFEGSWMAEISILWRGRCNDSSFIRSRRHGLIKSRAKNGTKVFLLFPTGFWPESLVEHCDSSLPAKGRWCTSSVTLCTNMKRCAVKTLPANFDFKRSSNHLPMCRLAVSQVNVLFVLEQNLLCHDSLQHSVTRNGEKKPRRLYFCSKTKVFSAAREV